MDDPLTRRLLIAADEAALEAFLVQHRDTSMFLRSNVRLHASRRIGEYALVLFAEGRP